MELRTPAFSRQAPRRGYAIPLGDGHSPDDFLPQPDTTPLEHYFTFEQAALLCQCPVGLVRRIVRRGRMKRYKVKLSGRGRPPEIWLPTSTVREIRKQIVGVP